MYLCIFFVFYYYYYGYEYNYITPQFSPFISSLRAVDVASIADGKKLLQRNVLFKKKIIKKIEKGRNIKKIVHKKLLLR